MFSLIYSEVQTVLDSFPLEVAEGVLERFERGDFCVDAYFDMGDWENEFETPCLGCFYGSIVIEVGLDFELNGEAEDFCESLRPHYLISRDSTVGFASYGLTPVEDYLFFWEEGGGETPTELIEALREYIAYRKERESERHD